MCGRYASARKRAELLEECGVQRDRADKDLAPDYNVAPTKPVYAVVTRKPGHEAEAKADEDADREDGPERQLRVVRWGLVPFWAKDPAIGSRMINARSETIAEKPAFKRAFARRRCLIPADGFYEWQQLAGPDGGKRKQPYFIYRADGGALAFAGLYELWRDKSVPEEDPASWLWTSTIITTSAADEVGQIHDRMPMVIDPSSWADWLDPDNTEAADVTRLLVPAMAGAQSAGLLTSHPVSTAVNNVRNNGPELMDEVPLELPGAAQDAPRPRSGPLDEPPPGGRPSHGSAGDTLF
jgi:putative SOS response-associated peptidase YedK